jgi:putative nucleotidyltransferase with HDIG domain
LSNVLTFSGKRGISPSTLSIYCQRVGRLLKHSSTFGNRMHVESAQSSGNHVSFAAVASSVVARWYGPILAITTALLGFVSIILGYVPDIDRSLLYALPVALLLVIGGELFIIALPFSWGTAQVSVGAICGLGVTIWLGPVVGILLIGAVSFWASLRQWKHAGLAIENAASAALSAAVAGIFWWSSIAEGANPLTSVRTSTVFLLAAILHSLVNFGTVVVGTSLVRKEPVLHLAQTMSGGKNFVFTIPILAAFIPLIGSQSPIALLFFAVPLVSSHLALRALWRLESETQAALAALTNILELRDRYTAFHSERVAIYSVAIANHVPSFTAKDVATIERAARIHDIGKANVRDAVLLKPGALTDDERSSIESHASVGADLINKMHAYRDCVELIRHHHERWDGGGYPSRLIGDRIPLGARVMAVADSLDAMTTDRPYRKALTFDAAVAEIRRNAGTQFDPAAVEAFLAALHEPAFVQLAEKTRPRLAAD